MRREWVVPKLGLTMQEGTLVEWLVASGETVKNGQAIFVIESEKTATEIQAEADGRVVELIAEPGSTLPVGTAIAYWDDGRTAEMVVVEATTQSASVIVSRPPLVLASTVSATARGRISVTPLARRLAQQKDVDLAEIRGSGPRGRIRARDLPALASPVVPTAPSLPGSASTTQRNTLQKPSATELTVARRLTATKRDIPHFYLSVEAEVSRLADLRAELNALRPRHFTLNHFLVSAVARTLNEMPQINRVWTDDGILILSGSDVGIAVHTERGLLVPILRDGGRQSIADIAIAATGLIERARSGRLGASEMVGGAITVSNAGMHDVTYMTSIINPGQAMILGVASVRELFRPDAAGRPELRREIGLTLSVDHRVLDGVRALAFLKGVVRHIENPAGLVLAA
jgi:pyruvate dehydrogenase E2 component (dihydrolipoamide acetyltransferase)